MFKILPCLADFVDMMISKVLCDSEFTLNHLLKSADDWCIATLKNIIKTYEYVDFFFFSSYIHFSL